MKISTQLALIYISSTYAAQLPNDRFHLQSNAEHFPARLFEMMRTYYEDANLKIQELNPLRFMYEESPHFEQGYVMHEIIERYRKMVELVTRQHQPRTYVLGAVERLRDIQKIYFEVYHLVNIMHEIPRKWKGVAEFNEDDGKAKADNQAFKEAQAAYERADKIREKEKKKRMKALKKTRLDFISGKVVTEKPGAKRHPYNPIWPIDYGWEIDNMTLA